jgi:hypothetical protein
VSAESDLATLTDELYTRPPAEFVARRDELAREARASSDRALATQIKALRRPSVGAWYLNSGVRAGLAALTEFMELGRQLRQAQGQGDFAALRNLGSRRRPLTADALRDLAAHLVASGVAATPAGLDEARTTLTSALADPEVAEELAQGRLDRPHVYAGFGDLSAMVPSAQAAAASGSGKAEKADVTEKAAEAEARAAREAAAREESEKAARLELEGAEAELAEAADDHAAAQAAVEATNDRVDALTSALAEAKTALRAAKAELETATTRQTAAQRRLERARRDAS